MCSFGSLMISGLMFTSLIYFKLIFESGEHLCILTVAFSMESQKYAVLN